MKKVLSILLALSFVVQPAYSVAQPAQPPKKGVITRAKEKWSAMKEAVKKGSAVLKANWQCITKGKGEKCSPDRYLSLQIIRNFVKGNTKAAKEGLQKLVQAHKDCWVPVLVMLVGAGFVTSGFLEDLFTGESLFTAITWGVGITAFGPIGSIFMPMGDEATFKWERVKKCMLVIGVDLPIVIALGWILYKMTYRYETSPEHINDKHDGMTFLHLAVRKGDVDFVKELLAKGASVNVVNDKGETPLYMAVAEKFHQFLGPSSGPSAGSGPETEKKRLEITQLLLGKRAGPNTPNKDGNTPLHIAAQKGFKGVAQVLLTAGADANLPNNKGQTPAQLTTDAAFQEMLKSKLASKSQ